MTAAVRLLADDLTGALDTAAELVPLAGPLTVAWAGAPPAGARSWALDSGTREQDIERATAVVTGLALLLARADYAFKKVDSLLRGSAMAELAACLREVHWTRCVVAPAFPHQGRVTRDGRQYARRLDGSWSPVGDVRAMLAEIGFPARRGHPGDTDLPTGITVFDADTDEDLRAIADLGHATGERILWCGSAGLAQALAHGAPAPPRPPVRGPVLGLFGSDQDVTARQLAACEPWRLRLPETAPDAGLVRERWAHDGVALATVDLPDGLPREEAATRIAAAFGALARSLERPGTLLVAGGETLRALCEALGATSLEVRGQFEPGLPHSVMKGGRWDGLTVVSKSGAFGGPALWRDLLHDAQRAAQIGRPAEKVSA